MESNAVVMSGGVLTRAAAARAAANPSYAEVVCGNAESEPQTSNGDGVSAQLAALVMQMAQINQSVLETNQTVRETEQRNDIRMRLMLKEQEQAFIERFNLHAQQVDDKIAAQIKQNQQQLEDMVTGRIEQQARMFDEKIAEIQKQFNRPILGGSNLDNESFVSQTLQGVEGMITEQMNQQVQMLEGRITNRLNQQTSNIEERLKELCSVVDDQNVAPRFAPLMPSSQLNRPNVELEPQVGKAAAGTQVHLQDQLQPNHNRHQNCVSAGLEVNGQHGFTLGQEAHLSDFPRRPPGPAVRTRTERENAGHLDPPHDPTCSQPVRLSAIHHVQTSDLVQQYNMGQNASKFVINRSNEVSYGNRGNGFRQPRVQLENFDGKQPHSWIRRCERHFHFYSIPDDQKVDLAAVYLQGDHEVWFYSLLRSIRALTWDEIVTELCERYGDEEVGDVVESFNKLTQVTTVKDYMTKFENLRASMITIAPRAPESFYVSSLISGLKPKIKNLVKALDPASLSQAFAKAKLVEASNLTFLDRPKHREENFQHQHKGVDHKRFDGHKDSLNIEKEPRNRCFKCHQPYVPGHRCNPKLLMMARGVDVEGEFESDEDDAENVGSDQDNGSEDEVDQIARRKELHDLTTKLYKSKKLQFRKGNASNK